MSQDITCAFELCELSTWSRCFLAFACGRSSQVSYNCLCSNLSPSHQTDAMISPVHDTWIIAYSPMGNVAPMAAVSCVLKSARLLSSRRNECGNLDRSQSVSQWLSRFDSYQTWIHLSMSSFLVSRLEGDIDRIWHVLRSAYYLTPLPPSSL